MFPIIKSITKADSTLRVIQIDNYLLTQNGETHLRLYKAEKHKVVFCHSSPFFSRICWVDKLDGNLVVILLAD
jgi:hypothetical protein